MSNKNNVISITKATNRQLPAEAYLPESIGKHVVSFFREEKLSRNEGLLVLKSMYELLSTGESEDITAHQYVTSFTDLGVTPDELLNGMTWVLDTMKDLDAAIASGLSGVNDDKTIH